MDKRRVVKSLIHKLNVDIICLQETKLEGGVRERIKEIWGDFECRVYAPNYRYERENVNEEIGAVRGLMGDLWLFVGLQHLKISFRKNPNWKGALHLVQGHMIASRIDKSLFFQKSGMIDSVISHNFYKELNLITSIYHCNVVPGNRTNPTSNLRIGGKPDYILACKLKALKGKLKEWSRSSKFQGTWDFKRLSF
ncbi:hypothetical protein H5410_022579 [Solanum commersonii]|uniref:Endonuclease/exonuclease/phosphatase domain-containing protein n=1 Tax=Solanum commersonii TaxID=4109 RepID=A0A9J5ZF74_SOLCO|nr:hypothetical protein H5410_022579 [Solanum commersonii]